MSDAFICRRGGGTSLNYTVVGGTTAPTNPKENTVWVNTEVAISSYVFSSTEPASPTEGMAWIVTSTSANAPFDAIKKNGLWVYPTEAQQCISGSWVMKTAQTWQNGEWVEWWKVVYKSSLTTWSKVPPTGTYFTAGSFSEKTVSGLGQCLALESVSRASIGFITQSQIDFTGYSKMTITGKAERNLTVGGNYVDIRADTSDDSRIAVVTNLNGTFSVDIVLPSPTVGLALVCGRAWCENSGTSYHSKLYISGIRLT